jgi:hypothetical protein
MSISKYTKLDLASMSCCLACVYLPLSALLTFGFHFENALRHLGLWQRLIQCLQMHTMYPLWSFLWKVPGEVGRHQNNILLSPRSLAK